NNMAASTATTSNKDIASDISDNPVNVICSFCKQQFSITTATDNLRKYLDSKHPSWNTNNQISGQQLLLFISKIIISRQILTSTQKAKLNMLIAEWIVSDTLPFSIVS
ncbi:32287_t:CDS:2, partial [Racocetra persica]